MTQIDILLDNFLNLIQEKEANAKHDLLNEMRISQFIWLSNLLVLILVLVSLVRPFIKRVTKQINVLSRDSALYRGRGYSKHSTPKRQDELYNLTNTFNHMAKSIADNKVHMLTKMKNYKFIKKNLSPNRKSYRRNKKNLKKHLVLHFRMNNALNIEMNLPKHWLLVRR